jgi:hypothetical protein
MSTEDLKSYAAHAIVLQDQKINPNAIVIAFRGTRPVLDDWETDIDFAWASYDNMKEHHGFLSAIGLGSTSSDKDEAYDALTSQVNQILLENLNANPRIIVTGHSLGGAQSYMRPCCELQERGALRWCRETGPENP